MLPCMLPMKPFNIDTAKHGYYQSITNILMRVPK